MKRDKGVSSTEVVISVFLIIFGILLITLLVGAVISLCNFKEESKEVVVIDDSGQELVLVREMNGLKVYRFYDKGYYRYFVDGRGKTMTTIDERKGTARNRHTETTPDEIETVKEK